MSNSISNFLAFLKGDLEVELLPVAIGALGVAQKTPGAEGIVAAEAYVLGNAPAALLAGQASVMQVGINDLQAQLAAAQAQLAKLQAAQSAAPATPPAT